MTAKEWLEVIKEADNCPIGMDKLIIKYGEMLLEENCMKEKLTRDEISFIIDALNSYYNQAENEIQNKLILENLGIIEGEQLTKQKEKALNLMNKLEK